MQQDYCQKKLAIFSIHDNGPGTNTDVINDYLHEKNTSIIDSQGYGIKNVNQRIKLQFGDLYGLHYETNEIGGVTVIVSLPLPLSWSTSSPVEQREVELVLLESDDHNRFNYRHALRSMGQAAANKFEVLFLDRSKTKKQDAGS